MATKALPAAKISTSKFLPSSKKKVSSAAIVKSSDKGSGLVVIEKKVIAVENLIKTNLRIENDAAKKKRIRTEKQKDKVQEDTLEEKPKGKEEKEGKKISLPKLSFLETIKQFLFKVLLGFIAIKLLPHLPKLLAFLPTLMKAAETIIDWAGKLLDGLVTFIDWGYKLYDNMRGLTGDIFGKSGAKKFDELSSVLNKVLMGVLAYSMIMARRGPKGNLLKGGKGGRGFKRGGKTLLDKKGGKLARTAAARKFALKHGRRAAIEQVGQEGVKALGGKFGRSGLTNFARNAAVKTLGKRGAATTIKTAAGILKPLVKRVPLVGAVMEFVLSWISGDPVGKAAFRGIGTGLGTWIGGLLGTLIPIPGVGTAIGMFLGGMGGSALGGAIYDMIFKGQKPKSSNKTKKMFSGGRTGRSVSGRRRKPTSRVPISTKIQPGRSVGGKEKLDLLFPDTQNPALDSGTNRAWWDPLGAFGTGKDDKKTEKRTPIDPMGYIEDVYTNVSNTKFFGPIMSLSVKTLAGERPSVLDFKNVGRGLSNWMYSMFGDAVQAHASGGEVRADMFLGGKDLTRVIEKSVSRTFQHSIDSSLSDLTKQLSNAQLGGSGGGTVKSSPNNSDFDDPGSGGPGGIFTVGGSYEKKLAKLLASYEGLRLKAYADPAHGWSIPTIGIGATFYPPGFRLSGKVKQGDSITKEEAYWIKQHHIKSHRQRLFKEITPGEYSKLPDGVKAALESKVFNYGSLGSTLTGLVKEAVKTGDYSQVEAYFRNNLASHNNGINSWRRNDEATLIGQGKSKRAKIDFGSVPTPLDKLSETPPGSSISADTTDTNVAGPDARTSNSGSKLAGELGRYLDKEGLGGWGSGVHQHPEHAPWPRESGHRAGSLHYASKGGRAIDIGGWGPKTWRSNGKSGVDDQTKIIKGIEKWEQSKGGLKRAEFAHEGNEPSGHWNHVHIAYSKGGFTRSGAHYVLLGERGREFVMDADSTAALENTFPGLLSTLNKSNYSNTINALRNFAQYEMGAAVGVDVEPEIITVPIPMSESGGGGMLIVSGDRSTDPAAELVR